MDLTFGSINISRYLDIIGKAILPLGILALVAMLVLPLPTSLLDTFFVSNILVSLLILMVALHTYRPLDFSSFPNLLLIATIFRLALNVASTRIVLTEGHTGSNAAGQVIEAFGKFVIAGNYTVGIFVFVILVIINLIVITKGAGRVAEVSARFTLDAMPGKQMAIDADLNAGVLTPEEATERREEIAKEADLDLVEVTPNAKPPVCKVMNYGKFRFEQNKKAQQAKKKQKQQQVKEIKLRPGTEENDYQTKLTNLRRFITDGDKAKITIRFRGRELAHKELGMKQVERIEKDLEDVAEVEQSPKFEGRQIVMVIAPRK